VRETTKSTTPATLEERLTQAIETKTARVGVIGLGYVGLPLVMNFAGVGFLVCGFDVDEEKVRQLNLGESYIKHIPAQGIRSILEAKRFRATSDFTGLRDMDVIIICVPTPLDDRREPDLSYVESTARTIAQYLRRGQLISLESTTYPGTTQELVLPILEQGGLRCPIAEQETAESMATDFFLVFSPEREDPGNKDFSLSKIPKVVGGINPASRRVAEKLYGTVVERIVPVSSTPAAEMTKLLENIYRCVNIALVNELKLLCQRMKIDIWEVIDASATKPFGFQPFYPGPGLGGHCIPIDPFYLSWKAREYDFATRFIDLAGEINTAMPYHVVEAVSVALNERGKSLKGSRILVFGITYKKDVDDLRESPSLKILQLLQSRGAHVDYHDPYFDRLHRMRHYDFSRMKSVPVDAKTLASYDCVVIATDHSRYDYQQIVNDSQLVVDSRNATRRVRQNRAKIVLC
jgi:UDP-N-acetyl-D-glucosamine dehydrogenase